MRYYNLSRNWTKRIEPHLTNKKLNDILVKDFNKFTYGLWKHRFQPGQYPHDFENCDWWLDHRGPVPRYWQYVKHGACHWLVNFALRLAMLAVPGRKWRILTSDKHSTVWDGRHTLFDLNYQAMGITAQECWQTATEGGRELKPGQLRMVFYPAPCWKT
jgi:hypothetical protein